MTKVANDPLVDLIMQLPSFEREIMCSAIAAIVCNGVPGEKAMTDATRLIERYRAGENLLISDVPVEWLNASTCKSWLATRRPDQTPGRSQISPLVRDDDGGTSGGMKSR